MARITEISTHCITCRSTRRTPLWPCPTVRSKAGEHSDAALARAAPPRALLCLGSRRSRVNANSLSNRRTFVGGQRSQDQGATTAVEAGSLRRVPARLDEPQAYSRSRRWRLTRAAAVAPSARTTSPPRRSPRQGQAPSPQRLAPTSPGHCPRNHRGARRCITCRCTRRTPLWPCPNVRSEAGEHPDAALARAAAPRGLICLGSRRSRVNANSLFGLTSPDARGGV